MTTPADVFQEVFNGQASVTVAGHRVYLIAETDLKRILDRVVQAAAMVTVRQSYRRFCRGVVRVN